MVHKVIEVGKSKAVVIPKEILSKAGLKKGARVDVSYNPEDGSVVLRPVTAPGELDTRFVKALKSGLLRYEGVLRDLSSR